MSTTSSNLTAFREFVAARTKTEFASYWTFHQWSTTEVAAFWALFSEFAQVPWDHPPNRTLLYPAMSPMRGTLADCCWFEGATCNYTKTIFSKLPIAETLSWGTEDRDGRLAHTELVESVLRLAQYLRSQGLQAGDRVGAIVTNSPETLILALATAAIGAVWASCSPDFGTPAILDRLSPLAPKAIFAQAGYRYGGKDFDSSRKVEQVIAALPSADIRILIDESFLDWTSQLPNPVSHWQQFDFASVPFDHPLWILFSSGTTGRPKCMTHSTGGVLLQHLKEHLLHVNLGPGDRLFYYTTCGWMMWNWMLSGLLTGASLAIYDGAPHLPDPSRLWRFVADTGTTVFGTSPTYLGLCEKNDLHPRHFAALHKLRAILSTGSPLSADTATWCSNRTEVPIFSISGGSDIVGCFMMGCPGSEVSSSPGTIEGPALGMAVEVWDAEGRPLPPGEPGELVCTQPFPSIPLNFWGDTGCERFRASYFETYAESGVWHHGDFVERTESGGFRVLGRSDATLNVNGVRIGTAEIYATVLAIPSVADCLAIERLRDQESWIALFVKAQPETQERATVEMEIRLRLRQERSPRHVPKQIFWVREIPYTRSGKKVELAVARIFQGRPVTHEHALAHPETLEEYRRLAKETTV